MKIWMASATVAALLMGCTQDNPAFSSFYREAGSEVDNGYFGNATMNNMQVQSGQQGYRINLARRFAAEVPSTINFAFNSTALDADARAALRQQADWIKQFPEIRFKVYGHTDLVGGGGFNRRLGLRRAQTVVLYLVSRGVSRSRLEAVVSQGETQPLVVTEGRERRNRRTVTDVSGFVENNTTVMNGKYAEIIFREYVVSATSPTSLVGIQGAEFATDR